MKCNFQPIGNKCVCTSCGFEDSSIDCSRVHRKCLGQKIIKIEQKEKIGCGNCEPPNLIQKTKNLSVALKEHVLAGLPVVSDEVQQRRIKICEACPLFNPDHRTCNACGCSMDEKTRWAEQRCAGFMIGEEVRWEAEV